MVGEKISQRQAKEAKNKKRRMMNVNGGGRNHLIFVKKGYLNTRL
jgi:hypothetical protein